MTTTNDQKNLALPKSTIERFKKYCKKYGYNMKWKGDIIIREFLDQEAPLADDECKVCHCVVPLVDDECPDCRH